MEVCEYLIKRYGKLQKFLHTRKVKKIQSKMNSSMKNRTHNMEYDWDSIKLENNVYIIPYWRSESYETLKKIADLIDEEIEPLLEVNENIMEYVITGEGLAGPKNERVLLYIVCGDLKYGMKVIDAIHGLLDKKLIG